MTRRIIDIPETFHFETDYRVVYSDINAANHLAADRILPIALEAQFRFIKNLGYSDAIVFEDAGLIMVHSETEYKSESFHDDVLNVSVAVTELKGKSIELFFLIANKGTQAETARVRATLLFFDYKEQKVTQVPEGFKQRVNNVYETQF